MTELAMQAKDWFLNNFGLIMLWGLVLIQWVAFQALLIHYQMFRKSLKRPKTDGIRFSMIERNLAFYGEQIETLYEKVAETRKDMSAWAKEDIKRQGVGVRQSRGTEGFTSVESTYASLGELNLKRRLASLKQSSPN